jgi:hypothetical protein
MLNRENKDQKEAGKVLLLKILNVNSTPLNSIQQAPLPALANAGLCEIYKGAEHS